MKTILPALGLLIIGLMLLAMGCSGSQVTICDACRVADSVAVKAAALCKALCDTTATPADIQMARREYNVAKLKYDVETQRMQRAR